MGSKKLAGLYTQHLKLASNQEKISESFIDSALTIHRRLLSLPKCQEVLEWCDQNWLSSNAWKSVYALQALIDRAGTPELIAWSLEGMVDGVRMSFIDAGFFCNQQAERLKAKLHRGPQDEAQDFESLPEPVVEYFGPQQGMERKDPQLLWFLR